MESENQSEATMNLNHRLSFLFATLLVASSLSSRAQEPEVGALTSTQPAPKTVQLRPDDVTTMVAGVAKETNGARGENTVAGFISSDVAVKFSVNAPKAGDYSVTVIFSSPTPHTIEVSAGATAVSARSIPKTWQGRPIYWRQDLPGVLQLKQGENQITFRVPDARDGKAGNGKKTLISVEPDEFTLYSLELGTPAARKAQLERAKELHGDAFWMKEGKYGLFVHFSAVSVPFQGAEPRAKWFQKSVEMFDVKVFADAVERTGAAWVNFTATHQGFYWPGPSAAIAKIEPGRTTRRDLLGEIMDELAQRGIRTLLYLHTGYNGYESDAWRKVVGARDANPQGYSDNIEAILRECSLRYGKRLSGFGYIDGCLQHDYPLDPSWEKWARAIKAGNPGALVGFSSNRGPTVTPFSDLSVTDSGGSLQKPEVDLMGPGRQLGDVTPAAWFFMDAWVSKRQMNGKFPDEPRHRAKEYVDYFKDMVAAEIPMTINMVMTADVTAQHPIFNPKCMAIMEEVRKAIRGK